MKSINEVEWKIQNIPERLILKNKQNYKISYLLSKIFLEKKYSEEEIHNTLFEKKDNYIDVFLFYKFELYCKPIRILIVKLSKNSFRDITERSYKYNINVHLNSFVWLAKYFADSMKKRKIKGSIIQFNDKCAPFFATSI